MNKREELLLRLKSLVPGKEVEILSIIKELLIGFCSNIVKYDKDVIRFVCSEALSKQYLRKDKRESLLEHLVEHLTKELNISCDETKLNREMSKLEVGFNEKKI